MKTNPGRISPAEDAPIWKLSPVEIRIGAAAVALSLVARWRALPLGYGVDDYRILYDHGIPLEQSISQSRPLIFALQTALSKLGMAPPESSVLGSIMLMFALAAMGIAICRLWGIRDRSAECAVAVFLIVLHPYQAEVFTFRVTPIYLAIPLILSFAALLTCTRSRCQWLLALVALACSLSMYQVVLNYVAMALLFSVVFHVAGAGDRSPHFWRTLRSQLALIGAGIGAFTVMGMAISRISGLPLGNRGDLIGVQEIGPRVHSILAQLKIMFFGTEPVMPVGAKLLLMTLFAIMAAYAMVSERKAAPVRAVALALGLAGGVPLCIGAVLVLKEWWPMPRVLAQTGIFWGGMFALLCHFARPAGRRVLFAGVSLVLFAFIGLNDVILTDQLRTNMRDILKANRIVSRVESLPGFEQIQGVVISGGFWAYPSTVRTIQGDMNISALYVPWSKVPLLNEATGYRFLIAPQDITLKANAYCETAPKWPAAESVIKMGTSAVVCLTE